MKEVKVKKERLLKTLEENKKTHRDDFEIAWDKFRERATSNLEQRLVAVKNATKGQEINLWVNLEVPQDHTEDYDRAIETLSWEIGKDVTLTEREFQQFVQDDWGWSSAFKGTNIMYAGSASPSKTGVH